MNIPKSVQRAISSASKDIVAAMKGSGSKVNADMNKTGTIIERFVTGIVSDIYPKTRNSWINVDAEDNSWIEKSSAATDVDDAYAKMRNAIKSEWAKIDNDRKMALISAHYKPEYWDQFFSDMYIRNIDKMKEEAPEFFSAYKGVPGPASAPAVSMAPKSEPTDIDKDIPKASDGAEETESLGDIFKKMKSGKEDDSKKDRDSEDAAEKDLDKQTPQRPGKMEKREDEFNTTVENKDEVPHGAIRI